MSLTSKKSLFQSFQVRSSTKNTPEKLKALRNFLQKENFDAFFLPIADEYQGEYIAAYAQRLQWLTGFTGSSGAAIILKDSAILFTDPRYTIQIQQETDPQCFTYEDSTKLSPLDWLRKKKAPLRLCYDPWLHTISEIEILQKIIEKNGGLLHACAYNPIDEIWHDQPEKPKAIINLQPVAYAGQSAKEKIALLTKEILTKEADIYVLCDPSAIAWALNIRGNDVAHNPVPHAYALFFNTNKAALFLDNEKLSQETRNAFSDLVEFHPKDAFITYLKKYSNPGYKILLDDKKTPHKVCQIIKNYHGNIEKIFDPITDLRAIKNPIEIKGARDANFRDSLAVTRFLAWLDRQKIGTVTEISAAEMLEYFRRETAQKLGNPLLEISFDTISGSGANGAIIHYRVTEKSNKILQNGELFLIDSGGQYQDGTTDITRTVAIGSVNPKLMTYYTHILRSLINLSEACFPAYARGQDLDIFARQILWREGIDCPHGIGHGVGSYLNVHEGPQAFSPKNSVILKPGMILSNEPGYYVKDEFGIRLENLLLVKEAAPVGVGPQNMLSFETLTFCPFDKRLIQKELLESSIRDWLNNYHKHIYTLYSSYLTTEEKNWLYEATKPI